MDRRARVRSLALLGAFAAVSLMALLPAWAANKSVAVNDDAYSPRNITLTAGSTVTWTDNGVHPHSVKSNTGQSESFDSSPGCGSNPTVCMTKGEKFSHKFTHAGSFTYYCEIHGSPGDTSCPMCGKVVVQAASTPFPSLTPIPTKTRTPSPVRTATPTIAPRITVRPVTVVQTPSPSPSPTPSVKPTVSPITTLVEPTFSPDSSQVAFGSPAESNRGPLLGFAIAAVGIAIGGGILIWYRLRGPT